MFNVELITFLRGVNMSRKNVNENIQEEKINTGCNSTGRANNFAIETANEFASLKNNKINQIFNNKFFTGDRKMKTTRLFMRASVVLALIVALSNISLVAGPKFPAGNGSSSNPYQIQSKADLDELTRWVNNENGINNWERWSSLYFYFVLMADITDVTKPIGVETTSYVPTEFQGTFDGNGKKILLAMSVDNSTTPQPTNLGLFGYTKNATIKNLIVSGYVNCLVTSNDSFAVAGIVAVGENTTITNCINSARIEVSSSKIAVGGIAAMLKGNCAITLSANAGEITSSTHGYIYNMGGICGSISGSDATKCTVSCCINIGTLFAGDNFDYYSHFSNSSNSTGGILGKADYTAMDNCVNAGWVRGDTNVGGMIGYCSNLISMKSCLNTGVVRGHVFVYSLIGFFINSSTNNIDTTIINRCFYDEQMTLAIAIQGQYHPFITNGHRTTELTSTRFKDILSVNGANWDITPSLGVLSNASYPFLVFGNGNAELQDISYVASATARLEGNRYVDFINDRFYLDYQNGVKWQLTSIRKCLGFIPYPDSATAYVAIITNEGYSGTQIFSAYISKESFITYKKDLPIQTAGNWFKSNCYETSDIEDASEVMLNVVIENATIDIVTAAEGNLNVAIYDLSGSKIMDIFDEFVNENSLVTFDLNDLSNLATGAYVVIVTSGDDVVAKKIIKQ